MQNPGAETRSMQNSPAQDRNSGRESPAGDHAHTPLQSIRELMAAFPEYQDPDDYLNHNDSDDAEMLINLTADRPRAPPPGGVRRGPIRGRVFFNTDLLLALKPSHKT